MDFLPVPALLACTDGCAVAYRVRRGQSASDVHAPFSCSKRRASSQCLPFSHALMAALWLTTSGVSNLSSMRRRESKDPLQSLRHAHAEISFVYLMMPAFSSLPIQPRLLPYFQLPSTLPPPLLSMPPFVSFPLHVPPPFPSLFLFTLPTRWGTRQHEAITGSKIRNVSQRCIQTLNTEPCRTHIQKTLRYQ